MEYILLEKVFHHEAHKHSPVVHAGDGSKCIGKDDLLDLVKDSEYQKEYHSLTENDKSKLLEEFTNHKAMKSTGHCITVKSKVNDILIFLCITDFMETAMGVDNQAFVSKMQGYAIQDMKEVVTNDPTAKMQWALYWHNVMQHFWVIMSTVMYWHLKHQKC
ncbi:hypothetical protein BU15DRAFT_61496 [Melanogaster broomeanus]|nr:hypothetical protein BU15DRAFT_61496 [Melanogaster broomeanus]